jgi:hypothetical protein
MTTSPAQPPTTVLSHWTDGLTADDAARVAAAYGAARTTSTRRVYAHAWRQWERWCGTRGTRGTRGIRGLPALPGDPAPVCAYLAERAAIGITVATLNVRLRPSHVNRSHGTDPIAHSSVRQVRMGLRRLLRHRPATPGTSALGRRAPADPRPNRPDPADRRPRHRDHPARLRRPPAPLELTDLHRADVEHKTAGLLPWASPRSVETSPLRR